MKFNVETWHAVVPLLLLLQCGFFLVARARPGGAGLVCWMLGSDRFLWWILSAGIAIVLLGISLFQHPFWTLDRAATLGLTAVLAASPLLFRIYPSSRDRRPSSLRFRLPLRGPVLVGWGGPKLSTNTHAGTPNQRWAYDLLVVVEGRSARTDNLALTDYYCYEMPVLAPSDGTVVSVRDGLPDATPGQTGATPSGGNQIVLEVAPSEFLFLCHLKPGSIQVKPQERVVAGQMLARVGNSGNTSEPHLHVHLQTSSDDDFGEGIPMPFHRYRVDGGLVEQGIPLGGVRGNQFIGQVIEQLEPDVPVSDA